MNKVFCINYKLSLSVYACFVGEWNTEMMSQCKLDPISYIVIYGPKKYPTSLLWKATTSAGKIQGQKLSHSAWEV